MEYMNQVIIESYTWWGFRKQLYRHLLQMSDIFLLHHFVQMFRVITVAGIVLLVCITSGNALSCYECDPCDGSNNVEISCSGHCKNTTITQGGLYSAHLTLLLLLIAWYIFEKFKRRLVKLIISLLEFVWCKLREWGGFVCLSVC